MNKWRGLNVGRIGCARAFTLVEVFVVMALLLIVMGLMVGLARDVRNRSASHLTRDLLVRLDHAMAQYAQRNGGALPPVGFPPVELDEPTIDRWALAANIQLTRSLSREIKLTDGVLNQLPEFIYDQRMIRDSWGTPILFLPRQHPQLGLASGDRYFFVSAGPDRRFLTRSDNLYSYDQTAQNSPPAPKPFTNSP